MDRATMQSVYHEINKLDAECEDEPFCLIKRDTLRELLNRLNTLEEKYLTKMAEDYESSNS